MVWWLFSKKKKDDKKWEILNQNLSTSFQNIREEFRSLKEKDIEHDGDIKDVSSRLIRLEGMIQAILSTKEQSLQLQRPQTEERLPELSPPKLQRELTDSQEIILTRLLAFMREDPSSWRSLKELTQDLYPQKKYKEVKSLISEYTDILENFNFITKRRKGRSVYIYLTKKGQDLAKNLEKNQKKELKAKEK
jgi:hypothetical protein